MAQPADQLVGRAAELESLDQALAELERRRSGALELMGEPGIGKTRLLAELTARADGRRFLVLSGSASELEHELPFGVFVDALDEYVQALEPRAIAQLDEDTRAELTHVLPSLPAAGVGTGGGLRDERYRIHRAVRRLLEALAAIRPLVVLLDDLHWADSGSLELLGALLRRPPAAPVLLALGLRPRQIPALLSGALERAYRGGTLTRIELGALTPDEASQLLGPSVSRSVAVALCEESGGNPFYLQQLARSLQHHLSTMRGRSDVSAVGMGVPDAVGAALGEELALLPAGVRRVLEGAAVAGDPFEPELAAAAAGVTEAATMEALDELLRRDLARPTDVPRRFRFRHPLVRRAVYETAPGGWRLSAHERSAVALAERGASAAARAHHVEQAARYGDMAAVAVLREAGEAVAQHAPAGAARWFAAALRLLPETASVQERVALLSARAGALASIGRFAEARSSLIEALRDAPDDDVDLRLGLTANCAGVEQLLGRHEQAHTRLEAALADLADLASPQAAALMINLAADAFYRVQYDDSHAWGLRALEVAQPLGERPLTAAATAVLAIGAAFAGATELAERHREQAAELIDGMPDDQFAIRIDAAAYLAGAECYLDRFVAAEAHARRGLELARATGQGELLPMLIPALATSLFALGRLAEAAEVLDGAIEGARLSGNDQTLAWYLLNRSITALLAGDLELGRTAGEESVDLTRELVNSFVWSYAGVILAMVLIEAGEHARGVEVLVRHGRGDALGVIPGGWRAYYLDRLTGSLLALGCGDEAASAAAAAEAVAAATGLRLSAALAARATAAIALATGDAAGAAERALASAALADEIGMRIEAGLSRTVAGRALAQAGDRAGAIAALQQAAAQLDACGARRYRDEAERELGRLGHRTHRRTRPGQVDGAGLDSLTARELEIAQLIVDRRTNAEIAATLFLSPKTVETHIRNLFHKLDVSSRVDVARAVERREQ